ncbi:hypothetical protein RLIN73S_00416 [Rhodanobacter lindaniclasticus]
MSQHYLRADAPGFRHLRVAMARGPHQAIRPPVSLRSPACPLDLPP